VPVGVQFHKLAEQEKRRDRRAVYLEQDDAAAHRYRAGRRIKGDVLLLADLAADVTENAGRHGRRKIAALLVRVENELVDQDLGVARDGQRRLVGEEQLRLADARRLDALVADDVMADHELAKRLVRDLARRIGVDGCGDADLLRSTECRSVKTRDPEGREQNFPRCTVHFRAPRPPLR
jgi:hypothetical protein